MLVDGLSCLDSNWRGHACIIRAHRESVPMHIIAYFQMHQRVQMGATGEDGCWYGHKMVVW